MPVLKADAIKYILTFRSVLPKELVVSSLPELVRHLMATSSVTHSYAASAIEKILILRRDNQPVYVIIFSAINLMLMTDIF